MSVGNFVRQDRRDIFARITTIAIVSWDGQIQRGSVGEALLR